MKSVDVDAKFVILAASTLENTRLLLLSEKGGLANSSGLLGHYLMDQVGGGGVNGYLPKLKGGPSRVDDGKMAGITMPSTVNYSKETRSKDFIRSYYMNATGGQTEYPRFAENLPGYGSSWKKEVKSLFVAQARVWIAGGEMLAQKDNRVELDPEVKDKWGIPVLKIHLKHSDNDYKLVAHFQQRAEELFHAAGGEIIPSATRGGGGGGGGRGERTAGAGEDGGGPAGFPGGPGSPDATPRQPGGAAPPSSQPSADALRSSGNTGSGASAGAAATQRRPVPLGGSIHEVGTARMSASAKDGVLNSYCQTHDIPNLYVFGGNAYPSTGDKHPTLTFMALTVRGCDHIIEQVKGKGKKKA